MQIINKYITEAYKKDHSRTDDQFSPKSVESFEWLVQYLGKEFGNITRLDTREKIIAFSLQGGFFGLSSYLIAPLLGFEETLLPTTTTVLYLAISLFQKTTPDRIFHKASDPETGQVRQELLHPWYAIMGGYLDHQSLNALKCINKENSEEFKQLEQPWRIAEQTISHLKSTFRRLGFDTSTLNFLTSPLILEEIKNFILNETNPSETTPRALLESSNLLEQLDLRVGSNRITPKWIQAKQTCKNWQTILSGLPEDIDTDMTYLSQDLFARKLATYLQNSDQDLDSLTSDLLEIPNLAQELNLSPEMEETFQNHLDLLRDKKALDLRTFWERVSSQIDGIGPDDLILGEGETLEIALTRLLRLHHGGIEEINLMACHLAFLPKGIGGLEQLQQLYLGHNQLTDLPESIENLKQLELLSLNHNQLTYLPEAIGYLEQLQQLRLGYNQLTEIPTSIENLKQLELLNLDYNQLTYFPESIGYLDQLQQLGLGHNQLTEIPESIGYLKQLQQLRLGYNQLTEIPTSIENLKQLELLNLDYNQLTYFPESIGYLDQLQQLSLGHNQLTEIPESIGYFKQLQQLYLDDNLLTDFPESIGDLSQLRILSLHNNQLTHLPESIGGLEQLRNLYLNNNPLTYLPESIGNLAELQRLFLSHNQLTHLPESIGYLSQLQILSLHNNQLTELPESIGGLEQLERLFLTGNQLTHLPESIGNLLQLRNLYLNNNQLTQTSEEIRALIPSGTSLFYTQVD